ncbi:MAG: hypothetical protein K0Q77_447 [Anaerosporomusa subterranea]|nr:hypothetical protein [Anaerosporomusa subterranea]
MGRARKLSIFTARPGMVLANDIVTKDGQVLLTHGIQLTNQKIYYLLKRRIPFVDVVCDNWLSTEADSGDKAQISNQTDYYLFYQETLQAFKHAFETARFSKQLPLTLITKLVDSHIGPLINARCSIGYLQRIQVHCDYTYRHSINVSIISGILGKLVGMTKGNLKDLVMAGLLHDIGKVSIPTEILNKPGRLTDREMLTIKTHPSKGYELLLQSDQIAAEIKIGVLQHHERIDGSGYPFGLTENQIGYYAKIIAIADIYDAMTSDRIYRKRLSPFCAAETIVQQMYTQLDPLLCLAFLRHIRNYLSSSMVLLSNGQKGEVVYLNDLFTSKPTIKLVDGTYLDLRENKTVEIMDIAK